MSLVSLHSVSKIFDNGTQALAAADLDVRAGEFLSLVGPSGCGKSTALRIIAGLIAPTTGTVQWPDDKPEIGFVFQEPTLMPWANAISNARLPLDLKHMPVSYTHLRAQTALTR